MRSNDRFPSRFLSRRLLARTAPLAALAVALCLTATGCLCRTGSACDRDIGGSDGGDGGRDPRPAAMAILQNQCVGCHSGSAAQGGVDLSPSGLEARIANAPSSGCAGKVLLVPGDPDGSYLIEKVERATPMCGTQMPPSGQLGMADIQTLREWVASVSATGGGGDAGRD